MSEFHRKIDKTETAFSVRNNPTILDLMLSFLNIPSHTHIPPSSMQHVICECVSIFSRAHTHVQNKMQTHECVLLADFLCVYLSMLVCV